MFPARPVNFTNRVRPGDHLTASVTHTSASGYTLVFRDATRGWSHTIHKSLSGAQDSSAEVIAEAPCCTAGGQPLPLADFGTVHFSNAKANGSAIGLATPTKIVMVDMAGHVEATVSSLSGGLSFTVHWQRST
jgi:hypothetical protein